MVCFQFCSKNKQIRQKTFCLKKTQIKKFDYYVFLTKTIKFKFIDIIKFDLKTIFVTFFIKKFQYIIKIKKNNILYSVVIFKKINSKITY